MGGQLLFTLLVGTASLTADTLAAESNIASGDEQEASFASFRTLALESPTGVLPAKCGRRRLAFPYNFCASS